MKYIVFVYEGEGLPVAWHLQEEGHEVTVGMVTDSTKTLSKSERGTGEEIPSQRKKRLHLFDQMVTKIPADELLEKMEKIADKQNYFVFCEMNHLFYYAEKAKAMGFHGNFPTEEDYSYEIDRKKAKDFVAKYYKDINIQETHVFQTIAEAKRFLKTSYVIWVIKGFDPEANVFLPEPEQIDVARKQLNQALDQHKEVYERSGFLLERFIPNVIEISPQRMYYDGILVATTVFIENKTIGNGNTGYQTGCSADLVFPISPDSKIQKIAYPPIVDELAKQHKGLFFWDISLLTDPQTGEIFFGEFLPNRPGYNPFYSQLAQLPSINYFFEQVIQKKNPFKIGTIAASTRIFNLNRTSNNRAIMHDVPVTFPEEHKKDIWPMDIYKKNGQMLICGFDTNLAVITGSGDTVTTAVNRLFRTVSLFSSVGKYYRSESDFLSLDYPTSILNRLHYGLTHGYFNLRTI